MSTNTVETVRNGVSVTLAYSMRLRDGLPVELPGTPSPMTFVVGDGQVPKGLEQAILGLAEGAKCSLTLSPHDAFGPIRSDQRIKLERARLAPGRVYTVGQQLRLRHKDGQVRRGQVIAVTDDMVQVDLNHPLAGKALTFDLSVLKIGAA